MTMENQILNGWVKAFRQAEIDGREDECFKSYEVIRQECRGVLRVVKATSGDLRDFVDDIADDKLVDCLHSRFDPDKPGASFRAYYRTALAHAVATEAKRRNRERKLHEELRTQREPEAFDLGDQLELYAERKRRLIDGLSFTEPNQKKHMPTLLIDQRQRMARLLCVAGNPIDRRVCPRKTEGWERWSAEDPERLLVRGLNLQEVWERMANDIAETDTPIGQKLVVDSINGLNGSMTEGNWRKKVSRYRADVEDQLDEDELRYFLFH